MTIFSQKGSLNTVKKIKYQHENSLFICNQPQQNAKIRVLLSLVSLVMTQGTKCQDMS